MRLLTGVRTPMRDGVELICDLHMPDGPGPWPCLLQRVPYDRRNPAILNGALDVSQAVDRGYAVVTQDCRGRFESGGIFTPFLNEASDGEDTVAWAAAQNWCNGQVAMFGRSYAGLTQWYAASRRPSALKGIAPMFSGDDPAQDWLSTHGVFEWGFAVLWGTQYLSVGGSESTLPESCRSLLGIEKVEELLMEGGDEASPRGPALDDLCAWLLKSATVAGRLTNPGDHHDVPALVIGGWFDLFLTGALRSYAARAQGGATTSLLIGPWAHGAPMTGDFPELSFGPSSSADTARLSERQLDWFDECMSPREPPTAIAHWFHTGADRWLGSTKWPPATSEVVMHLDAGCDETGSLVCEEPSSRTTHNLSFNEVSPVPTLGGQTFLPGLEVSANAGPRDQTQLLSRSDVAHWRGEILVEPIDVMGEVVLHLGLDAALTGLSVMARLVEERSDGTTMLLCEGVARTTAVDSELQIISILIGTISHRFAKGSRVGLTVACSSAPRFRRWVTALRPHAPRAGVSKIRCGPGESRLVMRRANHTA